MNLGTPLRPKHVSIQAIIPYLNFDGEADEAMTLYAEALGAKKGQVMHFSDLPEHPFGDAANSRVMHAELELGALRLMVSDLPPGMPLHRGGNQSVMLRWSDLEAMKRAFQALGEGGKITMDLHAAFWGDTFGTLSDRFGVQWMFACPTPTA